MRNVRKSEKCTQNFDWKAQRELITCGMLWKKKLVPTIVLSFDIAKIRKSMRYTDLQTDTERVGRSHKPLFILFFKIRKIRYKGT
jgi:hypothetical protein